MFPQSKNKQRKKKKKRRKARARLEQERNERNLELQREAEPDDVEVEYVTEAVHINNPAYAEFNRIFEAFKVWVDSFYTSRFL